MRHTVNIKGVVLNEEIRELRAKFGDHELSTVMLKMGESNIREMVYTGSQYNIPNINPMSAIMVNAGTWAETDWDLFGELFVSVYVSPIFI